MAAAVRHAARKVCGGAHGRPRAVSSVAVSRIVEGEPRLLPWHIHGKTPPRYYRGFCSGASNPPSNVKGVVRAESHPNDMSSVNLERQIEAKKKELLHLLNQTDLHGTLGKTCAQENKIPPCLPKQSGQEPTDYLEKKANRQLLAGACILSGLMLASQVRYNARLLAEVEYEMKQLELKKSSKHARI